MPGVSVKFNKYKFYWYHKKRGKHEQAIQEALDGIEQHNPSNPWAYGNTIIGIKNGNYNEREHRERHEEVKQEFTDFNEDIKNLVRGIG